MSDISRNGTPETSGIDPELFFDVLPIGYRAEIISRHQTKGPRREADLHFQIMRVQRNALQHENSARSWDETIARCGAEFPQHVAGWKAVAERNRAYAADERARFVELKAQMDALEVVGIRLAAE